MLGLRLAEGLNLAKLTQQFGEKTLKQIWTALQPYYYRGWVEVVGVGQEGEDWRETQSLPRTGQLRLSDPEGFLFSNTVLAELFSQLG